MNIRELIELLQEVENQDIPVMVRNSSGHWTGIGFVFPFDDEIDSELQIDGEVG